MKARLSPPRWEEMTAAFGGRFDPPHLGHLYAVHGLFQIPRIKKVVIIPSATPPHKPAFATSDDRLEMTKLNFLPLSHLSSIEPISSYYGNDLNHFLDEKDILVHSCELDRARKNPTLPSYTYDTINEFSSHCPQLAFVIGADQLIDFPSWYRFLDLLTSCHWIVLQRQPDSHQKIQQVLTEWTASNLIREIADHTWQLRGSPYCLKVVPTQAPPLSSTQIRETLAKTGTPPPHSLLPEVWAYLKQKQLYGIVKNDE